MADTNAKRLSMNADYLQYCYKQFWLKLGGSEEHARIVARNLSMGDRQGKIYQGIGVLETIVMTFEGGTLDINSVPEIVNEGPSWVVYDGNKSSGHYTLYKMMETAIEKAREHGISIAFGSNHHDAGAFYAYTSLALEQDMFAIATNNAVPLAAPYGGMDFLMGVHPLDSVCPNGEELPMITSLKVGEGYDADVTDALLNKRKLKGKLLVDPDTGELTDDVEPYAKIIEGYRRVSDCRAPWTFATTRLYALNIFVETLASVINPNGVMSLDLPATPSEYLEPDAPTSVGGSTIIVIDPAMFGPIENVKKKSDKMVRALKNSKKRPGVKEIYIPGESGAKRMASDEPNVDILDEHWGGFVGFLHKYDLDEETLKAEWKATLTE